jgi:chloramphenicol 3-O phosphotransferase
LNTAERQLLNGNVDCLMAGKLIVLNGGSSAGKSSVALEFQELAADCWIHLGIDMFWYALPQSQIDLQQVRPEYYTWDVEIDANGLEWLSVTPGPLLESAMHARYLAIKVYLDEEMNVISDDLIWTRDWLVDLLRIFDGYEVWLVGLHVTDDEGARREIERSDRIAGANRGSARAAHADLEYDFELDTTNIPVRTLARELHEKYTACPDPSAFGRLRKRFLA